MDKHLKVPSDSPLSILQARKRPPHHPPLSTQIRQGFSIACAAEDLLNSVLSIQNLTVVSLLQYTKGLKEGDELYVKRERHISYVPPALQRANRNSFTENNRDSKVKT